MSSKITLTFIVIIMLASLVGCNPSKAVSPSTNDSSSDSSSSASNKQLLPIIAGKQIKLTLDASADGSTQQLAIGEVMAVTLESNPSTGFGWFATSSNGDVVAQRGEVQYNDPSASSTPVVGAPGTQTIYFEGKAAGTATITLDYKRGWETDVRPEKTITITVEVK